MTALTVLMAILVVPGPELLAVDPPTGPADLIMYGGRVLTMLEPEPSPAPTALVCRDGRIVWIGDDASALAMRDEETEVIDLAGSVAMPGLVDSHAHLTGLGKALSEIDLVGTGSVDECLERIRAGAADKPDGWLEGRGWDQNDWADTAWPSRQQLDAAVPGRPVLLRRIDGHAAWVSSEALRLAGITAATPDPAGGAIHRDAHGEPTGLLVDNAVDLVREVIAQPSTDETARRIRLAQEHCLSRGLVGVHEMGVRWDRVEVYRELAASDELGLRMHVFLDDRPATLEAGFAAGPYVSDDLMLQVRAIKLYADGALGSRGALLLEDYADDHGNHGLQVTDNAHLRSVCERAREGGWQVGTHAIGDQANRIVLDLYEELLGRGDHDRRWRIEHAQIVDPADLPRFAELGVVAAVQPVHCTSDMDWVPARLGDHRLEGAYAWRTLVESGAVVCFGTDFPIEAVDPLAGLYATRTRMHQDGTPPGGWRAEECLDGRTALRLYTLGSARAAFLEAQSGVLAPGRLADISVFSGDPTTVSPTELLTLEPRLTVVHGKLRWQAP